MFVSLGIRRLIVQAENRRQEYEDGVWLKPVDNLLQRHLLGT